MDAILSIFKYYIFYFLFMFGVSFSIAYFYIGPYFANDKPIGLSDKNELILFSKEKLKIKDEQVVEHINLKLDYYNKYLEKQKVLADESLEKKRVLLKSGVEFDRHRDSNCDIVYFIKNAAILGKDDLVKKYKALQKKEMPECDYAFN